MTSALLAGLGLGLSLIVAIGAQNAYILQVGVRGRGIAPVVAVCIASDVALICAGVAGLGAAVSGRPAVLEAVKWAGTVVLIGYGLRSLWAARRADGLTAGGNTAGSVAAVITAALALTWLNPHVYLDTVLLLGSASTRYGTDRWWFAAGAVIASIAWFGLLGFGARRLAGTLGRPAVWRALNAGIGVLLLVLAARLATLPLGG
ncbi:Lysine exporter protein (LYSE/YGGA) OS=Tsukamurella paurometabola (strain ATCC 8368 / DSM /CCUG 35730 / CIP 100753 / JCM 10117 / KCTC 9821 / NBRC 16120/ NCIMB 702349 / NCTC 13040) OX=521096 GN=Tpau_0194 PE=3 SV=1 [Tsukamurella paurometabola]|uniref:Lysine exporter protein (LYSE/YGGA) n=1 Tax=Tsukamurella paurometabola (strain ATCC 8368 / DSM 20162 / CCUG 35730 / CIP 100753 / JCM 10117 / KCTC 9821 / NBRC 16120 / NCIMB 702349 / NCTC 13040) TaxID=521096 RepID=D5UQL5_TSUPD|nr:LysE family transporter [Tsukamurella paurometabola]ADG76848.1 Lysine exporter protein (LYSE/YGGA) [Tsukamurella paurometabola DSM 20162]SUP41898.1 Arginine exporter protein ArgO [Tsukamurella paurometabola]